MGNARHANARLEDYDGPFFPDWADRFSAQIDWASCTGDWLREVATNVSGFRGIERPATSDGYVWYWALKFQCGAGWVVVLVPWAQYVVTDREPERSIAVHCRGGADLVDVDMIVRRLAEVAERWRNPDARGIRKCA